MKVTMVPSGTGFPLQSRIGSVATVILSAVRPATRIRRLRSHGSAATCCTTRLMETLFVDATNCAAPAFVAELLLVQATPERLVTVFAMEVPPTESLKFTGAGSSTRFWYLSKTKATPLITFCLATGTRDGRAKKLSFSGGPALTQKTCDVPPVVAAIQRPALRSSSPLISMLPDLN